MISCEVMLSKNADEAPQKVRIWFNPHAVSLLYKFPGNECTSMYLPAGQFMTTSSIEQILEQIEISEAGDEALKEIQAKALTDMRRHFNE